MITDGLFTIHKIDIPVELNRPITIIPFGCIHRHTELCNVEKWTETIGKMRSIKGAWYIGMGDYEDMIASKERALLLNGNLHDSTRDSLYKFTNAIVDDFAKEISFMKGHVIGLLGGNHYMLYDNGVTSDQKLCELLACKYLGCTALIRLHLICHGSQRMVYDIWAHHGQGAARTPGGDINRIEQMREAMEADLYIMGHSHKRGIMPAEKLELVNDSRCEPYIRKKVQWLARSGSFLDSYRPGKVSYNADRCRSPLDQGCVKIELTVRREGSNDRRYYIDAVGGYL